MCNSWHHSNRIKNYFSCVLNNHSYLSWKKVALEIPEGEGLHLSILCIILNNTAVFTQHHFCGCVYTSADGDADCKVSLHGKSWFCYIMCLVPLSVLNYLKCKDTVSVFEASWLFRLDHSIEKTMDWLTCHSRKLITDNVRCQ